MISVADIISQLSIDPNVIIILLFLPLVVTIIGFAKYVIGLKSLGIYAPIVLTFMFYEFGLVGDGLKSDPIQGFKYGLFLTFIIFAISALSYLAISKWSLHYYSKLAIVITSVMLVLIGTLAIADLIGRPGLLKINVFSLILIASVTERYMNFLAFKNIPQASLLTLETIFLSSMSYIIISWSALQDLFLAYPMLILLFFPVNYFIGKFSGLRVREYYRFNEILDSEGEEE